MHLVPVLLQRSSRRVPTADARLAAFGMYAAGFLAVVNISIMYLALPEIERALGADIGDQQWVLSIYPLMEGGFTLAAGVLGDLYGRRRVLAASTWLFVLATLACVFAPNAGALIVARGVQGIASAALLSLPLAILIELLPNSGKNVRTIQMYATVAGLAAGLSPLIGGALVTYAGWQSVFYFSMLLALLVLFGLRYCHESVGAGQPHLDTPGQMTSILACLAISYALIEHRAWAFVAGAVFAMLFVIVERRSAHPMVNLSYFKIPRFDASVLIVAIVNFAWYGLMLLCSLYFQDVKHLNEVSVGLYLMPCNAAFFIANLYSARIARAIGMRLTVVVSFLISLGGMAWLALAHAQEAPWHVGLALGLAGVGWGIVSTPATSMGMTAVRDRDEGFASGILSLSRSLFGVFGIAVLGSILNDGVQLQAVHLSVGVCFVLTIAFGLWILAMLRPARLESSSSAAAYS